MMTLISPRIYKFARRCERLELSSAGATPTELKCCHRAWKEFSFLPCPTCSHASGGVRSNDVAVRWRYADFRTALSTSVLPSDQIAPGTLWLEAMTVSNAFAIQLQSSSVMVKDGNSLMVWLPWPE